MFFSFFFFSSRRRHTRFDCDWSSDVCSSDLHQLERRWEHLRVRQPQRQRRLMGSLAESGQQTPIVVVLCPEPGERYLVIDGHKRMAALEQLGRDTIEATVWTMSAAEALLLERSLRCSPPESA